MENSVRIISIPLHIGDLLAGTVGMNTLEFGAHMRLLIAHYQNGEMGLPADDKRLANIAGVSPKMWMKIGRNALRGFDPEPGITNNPGDANWVHQRCVVVIQEITRKIEQNRTNGRKRNKKGAADAEQTQPFRLAFARGKCHQ